MIFFLSFIATGNVKSLKWLKSLVACLSATDCWQLLTRQLSNCKCAQIAMTIYSSLFRLSSLSCIYLQVFACHRLFFYFLLSSKVCYSFINIHERHNVTSQSGTVKIGRIGKRHSRKCVTFFRVILDIASL